MDIYRVCRVLFHRLVGVYDRAVRIGIHLETKVRARFLCQKWLLNIDEVGIDFVHSNGIVSLTGLAFWFILCGFRLTLQVIQWAKFIDYFQI